MAKTWFDLKSEIYADTDTEGETFVDDTDMLAWVNDAIAKVEQLVMQAKRSYLKSRTTLDLVSGQDAYPLPEDIYANKILSIYYNNGTQSYPVKLVKQENEVQNASANELFRYDILNTSASGREIIFYPTPDKDTLSGMRISYIRKASLISEDTDLVDIPEADLYIKQFIKDEIKRKELGPGNTSKVSADLKEEEQNLRESLGTMVPDEEDNRIELDHEFYDDCAGYSDGSM